MAAEVVAEVRTVAAEAVDRMRRAVRAADTLRVDMRRVRRVVLRLRLVAGIGGIRFMGVRIRARDQGEPGQRTRRIL
jgi:hypothetical protein